MMDMFYKVLFKNMGQYVLVLHSRGEARSISFRHVLHRNNEKPYKTAK